MKSTYALFVFAILFCCVAATAQPTFSKPHTSFLVDKKATKETVALYGSLKKLLSRGFMFGHQDDVAYGYGWKYETGRSDVKDVTGSYPAVYGFELGRLEVDHAVNIDSVPFDKMRGYIKDVYKRGGIITVSWHLNNPLTGKTAWDPAPGTVQALLKNGKTLDLYKTWLDKIALFFKSVKGTRGEAIPIIFRPFHELNGNWFWWGKAHCTPHELKKLYQFTVAYLRDKKGVHNLLYAYNTDVFSTQEEYLERYPGDAWADIIGFDVYQRDTTQIDNTKFITNVDRMLATLEQTAAAHGKIPTLTEFGFDGLPDSMWWTQVFLKAIGTHHISYALGWRNAGIKPNGVEFYVPYKGHPSAPDFVQFFNRPNTLFENDIAPENIYGKK